ncbi:MAG: hypothetical protein HC898_00995 [Phycisphaerales bacterium]|nr:hypothetical protein [Phycisphaerales bacterium]
MMMDDERRKKEPMLRPSLLPSLLVCRKANQDAGNNHVRVYENAAAWLRRQSMIEERRLLGIYADAVMTVVIKSLRWSRPCAICVACWWRYLNGYHRAR